MKRKMSGVQAAISFFESKKARRRSSSSPLSSKSTSKKSGKEKDAVVARSLTIKDSKHEQPVQEQIESGEEIESKGGQDHNLNQAKQVAVTGDAECQSSGNDDNLQRKEAGLQVATSEGGADDQDTDDDLTTSDTLTLELETGALNVSQIDISVLLQRTAELEIALIMTKDEKEKYKSLYEKANTMFNAARAEMNELKEEFENTRLEWEESRTDFKLCMRSVERFTRETEEKVKSVMTENILLKAELSKLRETSMPSSHCLEMNNSNDKPKSPIKTAEHEQTSKMPKGGADLIVTSPAQSLRKSSGGSQNQNEKSMSVPIRNYHHREAANRNRKLESLRMTAGGSLRNALLRWCKEQTSGYEGIEINNFSTSWQDGKAFAALLHSVKPEAFNYGSVNASDPLGNMELAITSAKNMGVRVELDMVDVLTMDDPPWEKILQFVTEVYCAATP